MRFELIEMVTVPHGMCADRDGCLDAMNGYATLIHDQFFQSWFRPKSFDISFAKHGHCREEREMRCEVNILLNDVL